MISTILRAELPIAAVVLTTLATAGAPRAATSEALTARPLACYERSLFRFTVELNPLIDEAVL